MKCGYSREDIYRILEDEIVNLKIPPGQPLSESDLCERFAVSRTPIRSVLQRLEENGFVSITPYKTTFVTLLDYDIVNQLIYQRVAVESMVIRDFIKICNPLLVEKMRYLIRCSQILLDNEFETSQFYDLDSRLHELWFRETKKEYLWECNQKAQCNYSRFRMMDIVEVHNFRQIVEEHEELMDIVVQKDLEAVEPFLTRHLYGGVTRLGERIYTDLKYYFIQK